MRSSRCKADANKGAARPGRSDGKQTREYVHEPCSGSWQQRGRAHWNARLKRTFLLQTEGKSVLTRVVRAVDIPSKCAWAAGREQANCCQVEAQSISAHQMERSRVVQRAPQASANGATRMVTSIVAERKTFHPWQCGRSCRLRLMCVWWRHRRSVENESSTSLRRYVGIQIS
jgi:hypothetical protein